MRCPPLTLPYRMFRLPGDFKPQILHSEIERFILLIGMGLPFQGAAGFRVVAQFQALEVFGRSAAKEENGHGHAAPHPRQRDIQKLKAILGSDPHRKMASAARARAGLQLHVDGLVGQERPPCNMKSQALSLAHYLRRTDWSRFGRTLHHRLGPVRLFPCPRGCILSAFGADLRHRSKP